MAKTLDETAEEMLAEGVEKLRNAHPRRFAEMIDERDDLGTIVSPDGGPGLDDRRFC